VNESFKLEAALARISGPHRIVLMHYAPIKATLEGESPEIFPFLGSSRLEDPLSRFDVTAVFHGHAHKGSPEGTTALGIPVYNVAHPVLQASYPDRPPFRLFEVHVEEPEANVTPIGDRQQWGRRASDRAV
jgi:Icc-related predicted phosphoesterase